MKEILNYSSIFILAILAYLFYCLLVHFYNKVTKKYKTNVYTTNKEIKVLFENIQYNPTVYLPFSLLQMAVFMYLPKPKISYKREYLIGHDRTTISLDWRLSDLDKPLILIIHGFTGGSDNMYMKSIVEFIGNSYNIVIAHYRGINDTPLSTNKGFHMGRTADTKYVIKYIKNNQYIYNNLRGKNTKYIEENNKKCNRFFMISISMGANITCKIFSQRQDYYSKFIRGFASISNPFYLGELDKVNTGKVIDNYILMRCKSMVLSFPILKSSTDFDLSSVKESKTCREYNTRYSMKLDESKPITLEDYYNNVSSGSLLNKIDVFSLFINSYQDCLNFIISIDFNKISKSNKNLTFITTEQGGHVTWSEGFFKLERVR